ncbi:agmatine deiminase family protein [Pelagicoccus sp. SDUM812003]|uniref:agmatine deiminase family protein n=1 Tax=Pelagicoccus sp. SDUM812003 TaxID=3041267 RepID=UPI00280DB9EE|nr:agmatine deiminase family protein [Pelagicoccus sp. SDUM812003]MDQ8201806.1 agmatine deiminase family protein [Pelagicoccus sp. SDUM812003]
MGSAALSAIKKVVRPVAFVAVGFAPGLFGQTEPALADRLESAFASDEAPTLPPGFFNAQTFPTKPIPIKRTLDEAHPAAAVLLNVSIRETTADPGLALFYRELIGTLTRNVSVWIGYDEEEAYLLPKLFRTLENDIGSVETPFSVRYLETGSRSFFVRDFGPIFALDHESQLVAIDPIYRTVDQEDEDEEAFAETQESLNRFLGYHKQERKNEKVPLQIGRLIRSYLQQQAEVSRPPLFLRGGDFMVDGDGGAFVSENVVTANGGSPRFVRERVREYFGVERVTILESLSHVKTIDLATHFRPLGSSVFMLPLPPPSVANASPAANRLVESFTEIRQANLNTLRRSLPRSRVVDLPTLAIQEADAAESVSRVRARVVQEICQLVGVNYAVYQALAPGDENRKLVERMIANKLTERLGKPVDLAVEGDLDLANQALFGESLETLLFRESMRSVNFRGYGNYLRFQGVNSQPNIVLPRYRALAGESEEGIRQVELTVEQLLKRELPGAELHWIEAEAIGRRGGTLRDIALPIPMVAESKDS